MLDDVADSKHLDRGDVWSELDTMPRSCHMYLNIGNSGLLEASGVLLKDLVFGVAE